MNFLSFSLVLTGVLLNAAAQLLLKAGTNSIGAFGFTAGNLVPVGIKVASNPFIVGGLGCYAVSVVVWIMALSRVEVSLPIRCFRSAMSSTPSPPGICSAKH